MANRDGGCQRLSVGDQATPVRKEVHPLQSKDKKEIEHRVWGKSSYYIPEFVTKLAIF